MEIIHIILGKANPDRMNGVNRVVHSLASTQHAQGHHVEVWGITSTPNKVPADRPYQLRLFQASKVPFKIDKSLSKAIKELKNKPLIQMHGGFITELYTISKLLLRRRLPFIFTPHGTYTPGALSKNKLFKLLYFNAYESRLLRRALSVQCLGHEELKATHKISSKVNACIIPNGQNMEELAIQKKELKKDNELIFGYCGRITRHQKGLDLLIEAFANYRLNQGTGNLWFIGDGEYMQELKQEISNHNLESAVQLYGKQFGEEKINIMANMDVFFHPSRNEGLPMAVIEAAGLGKPCVVSRHTSMDQYIHDFNAGYVLEHNTVEEIRDIMFRIENDHQTMPFEEKGINARNMIADHFTWPHISNQIVQLFEENVTG